SLGLATTGREEQQIYRSAVRIVRVGNSWEIEEQECELKGVPVGRLDSQPLTERPGHGTIRHAERIQCVRILFQHRDSPLNPGGGNARKTKQFLRGLAPVSF